MTRLDLPATVLFVGAGPGNPELLTVRARDVLSHNVYAIVDADVTQGVRDVVGEAMPVPAEKLAQWEADYEAACAAAKEKGARRKPPKPPRPSAGDIVEAEDTRPEAIARQLGEKIAEGHNVVRLVTGNPLSNNDTLAEINAVAAAGIEFQVVPGMSLPATVPTFAGIATDSALTEIDISSGEIDWEQLAEAPQPLVLQAAEDDLPVIAHELVGRGMADDTPVSVTVHGTTPLQRTYDVTLKTLGKLSESFSGTLVVTIGRGVTDRYKYSWWETRPLYGWRVLVPRAQAQAAEMSTRLATHGAIPQEVPTISLEPPRNPAQMERAIKGIVEGRYQWIVLTSANAVHALWNKLTQFGLDARDLAGVRIAAVGRKTAAAISEWGISPELMPPERAFNARGLVEVFPEYDAELHPVGRLLLPRADIAEDTLVDGLQAKHWEVDDVVAYRTVRAAPPSADVRDMIKTGGFDAVCFTSASTVRNLVGIAGKPHQRTIIACIGPSTAKAAADAGLRVDVQPEVAGIAELVDALAMHVAKLRASDQLPPPRKKRRKPRASSQA